MAKAETIIVGQTGSPIVARKTNAQLWSVSASISVAAVVNWKTHWLRVA